MGPLVVGELGPHEWCELGSGSWIRKLRSEICWQPPGLLASGEWDCIPSFSITLVCPLTSCQPALSALWEMPSGPIFYHPLPPTDGSILMDGKNKCGDSVIGCEWVNAANSLTIHTLKDACCQAWWCTSVILAVREAEAERFWVWG
jgi:hypothetical protein